MLYFALYFTFLQINLSFPTTPARSGGMGKKWSGRCRRSSSLLSFTSTRGIRGACSGARNLRAIITEMVNLFVYIHGPGICGLSNV